MTKLSDYQVYTIKDYVRAAIRVQSHKNAGIDIADAEQDFDDAEERMEWALTKDPLD